METYGEQRRNAMQREERDREVQRTERKRDAERYGENGRIPGEKQGIERCSRQRETIFGKGYGQRGMERWREYL